MAGTRKGPRFIPERQLPTVKMPKVDRGFEDLAHKYPGSSLGRWWGVLEGRTANWFGICEGECRKLYVLEEGEAEGGYLIGWKCQSATSQSGRHWDNCPGGNRHTTCICYDINGRPGSPRPCDGRVRELPNQQVLGSVWLIGGIKAVLDTIPKDDANASGVHIHGFEPRKK